MWPPRPRARAPRWCGVSISPVEPPPALTSNPGASIYVRRHRHHQREPDVVGASAATARHGPAGRAGGVDSGLRCRAEQPGVPSPARPAAVADTTVATAAQSALGGAPCAQKQAGYWVHAHLGRTEVLDGLAPSAPHCCGNAFIGTMKGAARSGRQPPKRNSEYSAYPRGKGQRIRLASLRRKCCVIPRNPQRRTWRQQWQLN